MLKKLKYQQFIRIGQSKFLATDCDGFSFFWHFTFGSQLGYLEVTVQEKLRSGWPGPFVKVEGCCD
jgi:hypothetical protein